ncbi:AraC family transcriptional regulator [Paramicrobacterium chengjingii]|uniref:AraC family transcriptional regulator n=1 Tax=Paramicrobacterium chengjingii TaxID=2769067 RepID=A0ABX6YIL6_9MICO|nr:AraC family transcriptional regulator [Microbacterium chengjingii]QPZ38654.1 AraC family transcriptional regulator [Microbacterium chengjingii]
MSTDRLTEILNLIDVRGVVSGGAALTGRWRAHGHVAEELKFCAVARGEAQLMTDGIDEPIELVEGEIVVLNARSWLELRGGSGDGPIDDVEQPSNGTIVRRDGVDLERADVFIGGRIDLNVEGREVLAGALPPVAHVRAASSSAARIRGHVNQIFAEIVGDDAGAEFAVRQYSQLLILDVLRAFSGGMDMPPGWLKLLGDERLRPALDLMHEHPEVSWSLGDLARAAALSRTGFAVRFREVAGMPPLAYLVRWRMLLAQRELRAPESRLRPIAFKLGYSSESAFSTAFKRHLGESPQNYRTRVLQHASPAGV